MERRASARESPDWMKSPVLDGVVLLKCWLISLPTLLSLSPEFTSVPGFSVSLIDSENHGLITTQTGDWQGAKVKAYPVTYSFYTDLLNDLRTEVEWNTLQP